MRYILYILTLALVFSAGMMVGNTYLPEHGVSLATAVSAPDVEAKNPILSATDRANAEKELTLLGDTLQTCPMVITSDKDALVNHLKLWIALEDFQIKRAHLESEIVKNNASNRPTMHLVQATSDYNAARAAVEKLADELFPATQEIFVNPAQITTLISSPTVTVPVAPEPQAQPAAQAETGTPETQPEQPATGENQNTENVLQNADTQTSEEKEPEKTTDNSPAAKADTAAGQGADTTAKAATPAVPEGTAAQPSPEQPQAQQKAPETAAN